MSIIPICTYNDTSYFISKEADHSTNDVIKWLLKYDID